MQKKCNATVSTLPFSLWATQGSTYLCCRINGFLFYLKDPFSCNIVYKFIYVMFSFILFCKDYFISCKSCWLHANAILK